MSKNGALTLPTKFVGISKLPELLKKLDGGGSTAKPRVDSAAGTRAKDLVVADEMVRVADEFRQP